MRLFARAWRDWAEEHWEAVGMALSISCALTTAAILALAFNVITTRLDGEHRDTAQVSDAPLRVGEH
jgi:hypothetical protein